MDCEEISCDEERAECQPDPKIRQVSPTHSLLACTMILQLERVSTAPLFIKTWRATIHGWRATKGISRHARSAPRTLPAPARLLPRLIHAMLAACMLLTASNQISSRLGLKRTLTKQSFQCHTNKNSVLNIEYSTTELN